MRAQVRLLRSSLRTIADLDRAMGGALLEHTKAQLLAPMPRIGEFNLTQGVAEVGPILALAADVEQACAEAGAAPVTKESGKGRAVNFRWTVNTRARRALFTFADNSRHASPWAAERSAETRRRGKRHPHAIRILMRACSWSWRRRRSRNTWPRGLTEDLIPAWPREERDVVVYGPSTSRRDRRW